jgi:cell division initiation protein
VARSLFGYQRTAVQDLLNEVADSFETVWRERHELADHVESLDAEIARLREREHALTQTLVAAEQAATHVRDQAKREADTIVAEAHNEARSVTRNAQGDRHRLLAETRRIEALLRAALGMIEESAVEVDPPAPAETPKEWPTHVEPPAPGPVEMHETQPEPPAPLRKISGGFDWGE